MKGIIIKLAALLQVVSAAGSSQCVFAQKSRHLGNVTVTGSRTTLRGIGLSTTVLDSLTLRDNISQSVADALSYGTSVYVKSSGRASLSTVSFRGTAASHTKVTWNGMDLSNPMMGMTDFSTIPTFFVDGVSVYHGASSLIEGGGGLGGLISLSSRQPAEEGIRLSYVQGAGSFATFDEFAHLSYGGEHWGSSTRVSYSSSHNDFTYVNRDKKENIYDDNHHIIGQYHPKEKNRSGAYKDFNILQEVSFDSHHGDRVNMGLWYSSSHRELPVLTFDYGGDRKFENLKREETWRATAAWNHVRTPWSFVVRGGYTHTWSAYDYSREAGGGVMNVITRSRNRINRVSASMEVSWMPKDKNILLAVSSKANHDYVRSADYRALDTSGNQVTIGYDRNRLELSFAATAKWRPYPFMGISGILNQEIYGGKFSQPIPALFLDGNIMKWGNLRYKVSLARNFHFPSLNDLYFIPGGDPSLIPEKGTTYDIGLTIDKNIGERCGITGGITWFDSYINNWIIWLPTPMGYFSPRNIRRVRSYGLESSFSSVFNLGKEWDMTITGSYTWSSSINRGEGMSVNDRSKGKQLPYVPRHSLSGIVDMRWRRWKFNYKLLVYSKRYTMTSNETSLSGSLPAYVMNNVGFGRSMLTKFGELDINLAVNNIFNNQRLSILSHPMPGINWELFVSITPKF